MCVLFTHLRFFQSEGDGMTLNATKTSKRANEDSGLAELVGLRHRGSGGNL